MTDQTSDKSPDGEEFLHFELQSEVFALEATMVREILDVIAATPVPGTPALVHEVINFRGKIIPLADLRLAFDMEASPATIDSRIVVIETAIDGEEHWLGFRADKVLEVAAIAPSSCEEPPMVGMRWNRNHVRCLARRGEGVIVIPDLPAIFEPTLRSVAPGMAAAA